MKINPIPVSHRGFFPALFLLGLAACSGSNGSPSRASSTPDAGEGAIEDAALSEDAADIDVPSETASTATRGTSVTSLASAKAVSELFVQEDPTINPAASAGQNGDAIAAQLTAKLSGDGGACAGAQITHVAGSVSVAVVFGSGCSVPSLGLTISGAASATVSEAAGTVTIAFTLTNLDVNGLTITGSASESTNNGTTYTSHLDVTEGTHHVVFDGTATLDSDDAGVTLTGTGTYEDGAAPSMTYDATGVHHTFGACYADAGVLAFTNTVTNKRDASVTVSETLTFSSTTPSTGQAQASIVGITSTVTLPTYGTCPHS